MAVKAQFYAVNTCIKKEKMVISNIVVDLNSNLFHECWCLFACRQFITKTGT